MFHLLYLLTIDKKHAKLKATDNQESMPIP